MLVDKKNILFDLKPMTKEEAILTAGKALVERGYVTESYIEAMFEREDTVSTYVGNGIGIPHGTSEAKKEVIDSGIVVLHFREGIPYDTETAYLVIGIAGKNNEHLELMTTLAIKFSDEDEVRRVVNAENLEEFYNYFNEANE